jgi:hypothetical protein
MALKIEDNKMKNRALNLYNENRDKFKTKRQASKYLNHYGTVYKLEHNIELSAPKRT